MEQNYNPRTQGFIEETRQSLKSFKGSQSCVLREMKETVDKTTGNVIPAHKALCFFTAKVDASGNKMRGANGGLIAVPNSVTYVNFGPSVPQDTPLATLKAQENDLEVAQLQSGNWVLYKPNYNGFTGEEW
jgi:hypothetical protein